MSQKLSYDKLSVKVAELERQIEELEKYKAAFEQGPDAMALVDNEGGFLDVNSRMCAGLGYTREQLLAKNALDLKPLELKTDFIHQLKLLHRKGFMSVQSLYCHHDGEPLFVELEAGVVQHGEDHLIMVVGRDISERKEAELQLHKHHHIISSTQDLIAFIDQDYLCQSINEAFLKVQYKSREDIIGCSIAEPLGAEQFNNLIKDNLDRALAGEVVRHQIWLELPRIGKRFMDVTYYSYVDIDGSVSGVTVNMHDITDLDVAKKQCELDRNRLDTILTAIPNGVYIVNQHYGIEYTNPVIEREFGKFDEKKCFEYLHSRTAPCPDCRNAEVFAGQQVQRTWKSEKNQKQYELYDTPLKSTDGTLVKVAFFHDVTRQEQIHDELIQQRFLFDGVVNNTSAVISVKDPEGKYLMINKQFEKLYKLDPEEIVGKTDFDIFTEKTALQLQANDQKVFTSKQLYEIEEVFPQANGLHTFISVKFPIFNSEGIPFAIAAISTDITERKRIECELQSSNENLTTLINASPDIICFKDHKGRRLLANNAGIKVFGLERVDYKGKKDSELAELTSFYRNAFLTCELTDEAAWNKGELTRSDERIPHPDGTDRVFDVIKVPLFHPDGERKGLVVLGRDITKRVQTEERLKTEISFRRALNEEMRYKKREIEEANTTLKVLLDRQQRSQKEIEENMAINLKEGIIPYVELLHRSVSDEAGKNYLNLIMTQIESITTPFARRLRSSLLQLSHREIQIAELIKQGKRNKEISEMLGLSLRTIETYRNNLRKKLNLSKKKVNLRSYLLTTFSSE